MSVLESVHRWCGSGHPCKQCDGVGVKQMGPRAWECDYCNGTGIEGDPRLGLLIIVVSIVLTFGPVLLWLWPKH